MDRTTLVEEQREAAQRLMKKLVANGFDVKAAAWIKTSDGGQWFLYLASEVVDIKGYFTAYREDREVQTTIRGMSLTGIDPFDVKLVSASHPLVADVQKLYQRFPAPLQTHFGGAQLAKMSIEDAWIYPPLSSQPTSRKPRPRSKSHSTKRAVKSER